LNLHAQRARLKAERDQLPAGPIRSAIEARLRAVELALSRDEIKRPAKGGRGW
jgi:hypothetical protein